MLSAARFEDWNPTHFLDVAEMTFALAIGYDWLHAQLEDAARNEIAAAIIQKGVSLPFTTRHHGWVKSSEQLGPGLPRRIDRRRTRGHGTRS